MSKPTAVVVGASRGIGQALLSKLSEAGYETYGTARNPDSIAHSSSAKAIFRADLTDATSLSAAAASFAGARGAVALDVLVVCGATAGDEPYLDITPDRLLDFYNTNVVGPLRAVHAFLPSLRQGQGEGGKESGQRTIVLLTSLASNVGMRASNALTQPPEKRLPISTGPYGGTKAALNKLGIGLFSELEREGFRIVLVHPGLVNTDMAQAMIARVRARGDCPWTVIEVDESTEGIVKVIKDATGHEGPLLWYRDWKGNDLPW
ncbi:hypothetical protein OC844_005222 [Tilletia horrida]|nr:hypothetical protein OC844_005222 [Tilletia horrida]